MLPSKFKFSHVTEDLILQLLKAMNIDKAYGIYNLSGKFLKDEGNVLAKPIFFLKDEGNILAKPISELCNLSIKCSLFLTDC